MSEKAPSFSCRARRERAAVQGNGVAVGEKSTSRTTSCTGATVDGVCR
jgi:hypothetical protein